MRIPPIRRFDSSLKKILYGRTSAAYEMVFPAVRSIVNRVKRNGDSVVLNLTRQFDCPGLKSLLCNGNALKNLASRTQPAVKNALKKMYDRVLSYHKKTVPKNIKVADSCASVEAKWIPYSRCGVYVPGGRASYPSTLVMASAAARAAGVSEVFACSPPKPDGKISPEVACAALICGVDRIFKCGGAQAIAAMAYGTQSVPRADIVVGPGNIYVTAAKKIVSDDVAVDFEAGPTELGVIADATANPYWIARDAAAQLEHGPDSLFVGIFLSSIVASQVQLFLDEIVNSSRRSEILLKAAQNSFFIYEPSLDRACEIMDEIAPEHLGIYLAEKPRVPVSAGAVFIGNYSSSIHGDYGVGPNHILPTFGRARFTGALSVFNFLRLVPHVTVTGKGARDFAKWMPVIARKEGLEEHSRALLGRARCK